MSVGELAITRGISLVAVQLLQRLGQLAIAGIEAYTLNSRTFLDRRMTQLG